MVTSAEKNADGSTKPEAKRTSMDKYEALHIHDWISLCINI